MARELPSVLTAYVPKGHRLWFAPAQDVEGAKPEAKRNPNATGGTNRRDWILCACGNGTLVEGGGEPTEQEWLDALNQCRLGVHSPKTPCLPVTMDGVEQPVRDAPPEVVTVKPETRAGRPKKETAESHA